METIKDIVLGYLVGVIASIILTLIYLILKNKH
jgi:heme/copper-type cytochrome/quinol oxidase subunit 4